MSKLNPMATEFEPSEPNTYWSRRCFTSSLGAISEKNDEYNGDVTSEVVKFDLSREFVPKFKNMASGTVRDINLGDIRGIDLNDLKTSDKSVPSLATQSTMASMSHIDMRSSTFQTTIEEPLSEGRSTDESPRSALYPFSDLANHTDIESPHHRSHDITQPSNTHIHEEAKYCFPTSTIDSTTTVASCSDVIVEQPTTNYESMELPKPVSTRPPPPHPSILIAAGTPVGRSYTDETIRGNRSRRAVRSQKAHESYVMDEDRVRNIQDNIVKSMTELRNAFLAVRKRVDTSESGCKWSISAVTDAWSYVGPFATRHDKVPEMSKMILGCKLESRKPKMTEEERISKSWVGQLRASRDSTATATVERKITAALNKLTEANAFKITCNRLFKLSCDYVLEDRIGLHEMCSTLAKSLFAVAMTQPNNTALYAKVSNWLITLFTLYEIVTVNMDVNSELVVSTDNVERREQIRKLNQIFTLTGEETKETGLMRILQEVDMQNSDEYAQLHKLTVFRQSLLDACQNTFNDVLNHPYVPDMEVDEEQQLEDKTKDSVRTKACMMFICQLAIRGIVKRKLFMYLVNILLGGRTNHVLDLYASVGSEINTCRVALADHDTEFLTKLRSALEFSKMEESEVEFRVVTLLEVAVEQVVGRDELEYAGKKLLRSSSTENAYLYDTRQSDLAAVLAGKEISE